jgi:prepilin-type N-terminal cleavage/methylation domain-containing protein
LRRGGYTLVEVLVALVVLSILAVPLTYTLVRTGEGSSRARALDDALALAREDWNLCRAAVSDSLRDSTWERDLPSGRWRVVRDVFDSADREAQGLPAIRSGRTGPLPPVEIGCCALRREGDAWDTARCFRWLRPRWNAR